MRLRQGATDENADFDALLLKFEEEKRTIASEVHILLVWCTSLSDIQFSAFRMWRQLYMMTNGLASVLAAATGVSALAEWVGTFGIGVASLLTAVLASLSTLTSASDRATEAGAAAKKYGQLRDNLRQFLIVDLPHYSYDESRVQLTKLTDSYHQINHGTEPPPFLAWILGSRPLRRALRRSHRVSLLMNTDNIRNGK